MSDPSPAFRAAFAAGAAWDADTTSRPDVETAVQQAWEQHGAATVDDRGRGLAEIAASWDENAAEERRAMGRPTVSVDEAVSGPYVADTWEQAASELRSALAEGQR